LACAASFWACGSEGSDVTGGLDAGQDVSDVVSAADQAADGSNADREVDATVDLADAVEDSAVDVGEARVADSASEADGRAATDVDASVNDGEAGSSSGDGRVDDSRFDDRGDGPGDGDGGPSAPDGSDSSRDAPGETAQPPFDPNAVRSILTRVAQYQLSLYPTTASNDWIDSTFFAGLMAAYRATQNAGFLSAARNWATQHQWDLHPSTQGPRFGDNQTCTQTYLEIFLLDPMPSNAIMYQKAQAAFDAMIAAPQPGRVDWWWCDALFMAPPALTRLAVATGQTKYFDFMNTMYWDSKAFLFAPAQGLFWRDEKYFNTETFWARGNGWVVAGLARILDDLPATNARRGDYVQLLQTMLGALAPLQGSDGLWRSDLTHPTAFPNPETSGTGFFTYATAWAVGHGVVPRDVYLPIVQKAWTGLVGNVDNNGRLGYVQNTGERPAAAGATETHPFGVGAFLLAGSEILKL